MKTIQDLFAISGEAVMNNNDYKHWFIDYARKHEILII
jgi:hypothetical protein